MAAKYACFAILPSIFGDRILLFLFSLFLLSCVCVCVTCSPPRSEVGKRSVRVCLPLSEREVNDSEREAGLRLQSAFDRRVWLVSDIERA